MIRSTTILLLLTTSLTLAQEPGEGKKNPAPNPVAVASNFLPPNARLADDYAFNFRSGRVSKRWPAVLAGHIVEPRTQDIVFVYYSPDKIAVDHTLFLDLVHPTPGGYEKMYEVSYRPEVLFGPRGLRLVHLQGSQMDAVAFTHGVGAALGARLEIFVWRDPWGWKNIFPPNSTGYTYFFQRKSGLEIALSTAKHPGLNVTPPPVWYRWDGKRFVKIPPPPGSSSWPLPD
jgi:hypothetical protein